MSTIASANQGIWEVKSQSQDRVLKVVVWYWWASRSVMAAMKTLKGVSERWDDRGMIGGWRRRWKGMGKIR